MRHFRNKFFVIWFFGLLAASGVILISLLPSKPLTRIDTLVFDTYQRLKPRVWAGTDVVVVDIDEPSLAKLGQWPWPRSVVAEMVDRLGNLGAAAIVFDVVFSEPDRTSPIKAIENLRNAGASISLPDQIDRLDNDKLLAEAFSRNLVVSGLVLAPEGPSDPPRPKAGYGFSGSLPEGLMVNGQKAIRNLPILDESATGIGEFSFKPTVDGVVRKSILLKPANDAFYPSLAMETLRVVQGAGGFKIKASDGSGEIDSGEHVLVSAQVGALEVPTDADGALDIYHSVLSSKPFVSAIAVFDPTLQEGGFDALQTEIANHIVLVGTSAKGLLDLRATPIHPVVPGVTVHADIIDQVISGTYLSRPDIAPGIERIAAVIAVLLLLAALPILNPLGDGLVALTLLTVVIGGAWYAFSAHQLVLSPIVPAAAVIMAYGAGSLADLLLTEREGRFVREAFGRYLSPTLVEQLADNPADLKLGGEERDLTLLFCDIRGFTTLSEGLDPVELTKLLNNFLTPMTTALLDRGATIDKYMGDAIMAFWNAPLRQEDHQALACHGLLAMRKALVELNAVSTRPIQIGMGINTGMCCVGNLGSQQRFDYSAIGDSVNVASRVEGLTKQYGLDNLVAAETLAGTTEFATLEVDRVGVVGRSEPLTVHTILDTLSNVSSEDFAKLKEEHGTMLACYRAGDVEEALVAMSRAQRLAGPELLGLYALYANRLSSMRETGVEPGWDGVFRSTKK